MYMMECGTDSSSMSPACRFFISNLLDNPVREFGYVQYVSIRLIQRSKDCPSVFVANCRENHVGRGRFFDVGGSTMHRYLM